MRFNTDKTPSISEALDTRITVRQFLDKAVPEDILRGVLEKAMRSPSGGNLQPWKLHVMTGDALAKFTKEASETTLCLLYTSPSPRDQRGSRMPSSA